MPEIPHLASFKGKLIHSASWDPDLNWTGKRIAIIGNGASAIQILPQMQPAAQEIVTYIRTPTWIIPDFLAEFTPEGKNFLYSEEQKRKFREDPTELRELRRKLEHAFNTFFMVFLKDSALQSAVRGSFTDTMRQRLNGDEDLISKLVPEYPVGCRRITPGNGE